MSGLMHRTPALYAQSRVFFRSLFVLLLLFVLSPISLRAAIPGYEREALVALYNSTDGDNWNNNTGWLGAPGTGLTEHVHSLYAWATRISLKIC